MGDAAISGTVLDRRGGRLLNYGCAFLYTLAWRSDSFDDWRIGRSVCDFDRVWSVIWRKRNHADSVSLSHQGQILHRNFDRGHAGICHGGWRRCRVRGSPGRVAVWLAVRAAGAQAVAGERWICGALLRDAQFLLPLEAAACGEEI